MHSKLLHFLGLVAHSLLALAVTVVGLAVGWLVTVAAFVCVPAVLVAAASVYLVRVARR